MIVVIIGLMLSQSSCFTVTSPDFPSEGLIPIPSKFTPFDADVNPQLNIEGSIAQGAKSLALVVGDPDAPNGTWYHWLVKDIPIGTKQIPQNSVPGVQVTNSWKIQKYKGPKPPSGTHRYYFTVQFIKIYKIYALDVATFDAKDPASFLKGIEGHVLEQASYMGIYKSDNGF